MMRRIAASGAFLLGALVAAHAPALAQAERDWASDFLSGEGALTCARYVAVVDAFRPYAAGGERSRAALVAEGNYWQAEAWMLGYVEGLNSSNGEPMRDYDRASMREWVYAWCKRNPARLLSQASWAFWHEVGGAPWFSN